MLFFDGWIYNNSIIWNDFNKHGVIARGFKIESPDFSDSDNYNLDLFTMKINTALQDLHTDERMQVHWCAESNYGKELDLFHERTKKGHQLQISVETRNDIYNNMKRMNDKGELRREWNYIFYSKKIGDIKGGDSFGLKNRKNSNLLFSEADQYFRGKEQILRQSLSSDCDIQNLNDKDLIKILAQRMNPVSFKDFNVDSYDFYESIFDNLAASNMVYPEDKNSHGFYMDGLYHSIIALKRFPTETTALMMNQFTREKLLKDFSITVNIETVDDEKQLTEDENIIGRLKGDVEHTGKIRLEDEKEKRTLRVKQMKKGNKNHRVEFIFHVWDKNPEKLLEKTFKIKQLVKTMGDAKYWESAEKVTATKLFACTLPGWTFSRYKGYRLNITTNALSKILPFSSTFNGYLEDAQILMMGSKFNPVGMKIFHGSTPQPAALLGMKGSGKSFNVTAILLQLLSQLDYLAIIEEGESYKMFMRALGMDSLVIRPDSNQRLNYLDTNGMILTSNHIKTVVAILTEMFGRSGNKSEDRQIEASIEGQIKVLYNDFFKQYCETHPEEKKNIEVFTFITDKYRQRLDNASFLDAWTRLRDVIGGHRDEPDTISWVDHETNHYDESEFTDFVNSDQGYDSIRDCAFSYFYRDDHPTHFDLLEIMKTSANYRKDNSNISKIYTALETWSNTIFAGTTNINVNQHVDHFDLGELQSHNKAYKNVCIYTINNIIRTNIIKRPRNQLKAVAYDEARRFKDTEAGKEILKESYAQFRKFAAWPIFITQQVSDGFDDKDFAATCFGNIDILFLMLQRHKNDLDNLQTLKQNLNDTTCAHIMGYPAPADLPDGKRFSAFTYFHEGYPRPTVGTICNFCTPTVQFIASSDGKTFEEREKLLEGVKDVKNVLKIIKDNANDMFSEKGEYQNVKVS